MEVLRGCAPSSDLAAAVAAPTGCRPAVRLHASASLLCPALHGPACAVPQVADAQIELACFQALQQQEQLSAPDRIERMRLLLQGQRDREEELQQRFKQLGQQRDDLREALDAALQQQAQQAAAAAGAS